MNRKRENEKLEISDDDFTFETSWLGNLKEGFWSEKDGTAYFLLLINETYCTILNTFKNSSCWTAQLCKSKTDYGP